MSHVIHRAPVGAEQSFLPQHGQWWRECVSLAVLLFLFMFPLFCLCRGRTGFFSSLLCSLLFWLRHGVLNKFFQIFRSIPDEPAAKHNGRQFSVRSVTRNGVSS